MQIPCPYCSHKNDISNVVCFKCNNKLDFDESQISIQALKDELNEFNLFAHKQYSVIQSNIEIAQRQLDFLENKKAMLSILKKPKTDEINIPKIEAKKENKIENKIIEKPKVQEIKKEVVIEKPKNQEVEKLIAKTDKEKVEKEFKREKEFVKKVKPQIDYNKQFENFFLTEVLAVFISPLTQFATYFGEAYNYYKDQNKLPAFFMTLSGIIALLFGFGYLMQFVDGYTFEVLKISSSLIFSGSLIAIGAFLHTKDPKYHDFGSSLMGLSISLNCLIFYFLSYSEFFTLFNTSPFLNTVLLILNSILAFGLAIRFNTKVVLIVSLFGGAFAPFYLNSNTISLIYFIYFWLLCFFTIIISYNLKWKTAGSLAFLLSTLVFEIVTFTNYKEQINENVYTFVLMIFAYLFYFFALYDKNENTFSFKIKKSLESADVFNLAGNTALLVTNLYFIYFGFDEMSTKLGILYALNSAIFLVAFFILKPNLDYKMQVLFLVIVGAFMGFAIPELFNQNVSGLFWSLEGLALVVCGFIFNLKTVRNQGYLLLAFGLTMSMLVIPDIALEWQTTWFTNGYLSLFYAGFVLFLTKIILDRFYDDTVEYERYLCYFLNELLPIWIVSMLFVPLNFYQPFWSFNLMIIPAYLTIAWGNKKRLIITEWLGMCLFGFLVFSYLISVAQVNDTLFKLQTFPAQVAAIELFISFWFLKYFYLDILVKIKNIPNKFEGLIIYDNGINIWLTFIFRNIFHMALPLLILPSIIRLNPELLPIALFISVIISFIVFEITKKIIIWTELHFLVGIASIFILVRLFDNNFDKIFTLYGISLGLVILSLIFVLRGGFLKKEDKTNLKPGSYNLLNEFYFYYLGLFIFTISFIFNNNLQFSLFLTAFYFGIIVLLNEKLPALNSNTKYPFRIGTFLIIHAFVTILQNFDLGIDNQILVTAIPAILIFNFIIYSKEKYYPYGPENPIWTTDFIGLHIINFFSYAFLLLIIFGNLANVAFTIVMTIHAMILLFHSTNPQFKLSLGISLTLFVLGIAKLFFVDMRNAETPQKVIVFMVIGVLMLISSFLFMKFKEKK